MKTTLSSQLPFRLFAAMCIAGFGPAILLDTGSAAEPLELEKWSGDVNVPDPVALSVAPDGTVYVTHSSRRKVADLDIRQFRQWIPDEIGLRTVDERRRFLKRMLPEEGRTKGVGSLADHNGDGSVDWRDLTVPSERILRLRDTDGDERADELVEYAAGFNTEATGIAAGVMEWRGDVYATIAPDLWRLRDEDGDGVADERESLAHGFAVHITFAGHDMHGLTMGPDGRIYWTLGDKGAHVETRDGRILSHPDTGLVFRAEPDGSRLEVFATGVRNVQEVAFDRWGNLFGVDNDADFAGERERLLYLVDGADYGWRTSFQYRGGDHNPWLAEERWRPRNDRQPGMMIPAICSSGDGPAGFAFNPGTALGPELADHFFVNQFPAGRINAFKVEPDGAGFRMVGDRVVGSGVRGVGLAWGPEGQLYVADWAGRYSTNETGAVWRADVAEEERHPLREQTGSMLRHGPEQVEADELIERLGHPDQRVRVAAQFELVRRGEAGLMMELAQGSGRRLARVHAVWGLGQRLRAGAATPAELAVLRTLLSDSDPVLRAQVARVWGDVPERDLAPDLGALLADAEPRVRLLAALAIARLGRPDDAGALIGLAADNGGDCVYLRHAAASGLAACLSAAELLTLKDHQDDHVRHAAVLALGRLNAPELAGFLRDEAPFVVRDAALAIYDGAVPVASALPALAALIGPEDVGAGLGPATLIRVLAANRMAADVGGARALVAAACSAELPVSVRGMAIRLLMSWDREIVLDMIDGTRREHAAADERGLRRVMSTASLDFAGGARGDDLREGWEQVLVRFGPPDVERAALLVADRSAGLGSRLQAFAVLEETQPKTAVEVGRQWVGNEAEVPSLRARGLDLLLDSDRKEGLKWLGELLGSDEVDVVQAALRLAMERTGVGVARRLSEFGDSRDQVPRAVELDWLLALDAHGEAGHERSGELAERATRHRDQASRRAAEEPLAAWSYALEGGDAAAGEALFRNHLAARCTSCHALESGTGSGVGPALGGIADRRSREHLLAALVLPQQHITEGFGLVTVGLSNGEFVAGNLVGEIDGDPLKLRLADGTLRTVVRERVVTLSPPVSVMPPQGGILTQRELRDVLEFLATLR